MPFWKFWGAATAPSIYNSILFALSTRYNSRRVEDSSYATWNAILFSLCQSHKDIFLVCPQYGLYVSRKDPTNVDTSIDSIITQADGGAKGVQVDNSIIIPTLEVRNGTSVASTVHDYLRSILSRMPWAVERELRVRRAQAPVLVEQKPPPSRHSTLERYCERTSNILSKAQRQAEGQARCLFSMPRFGHQTAVVQIVATGGWWCFRLEARDVVLGKAFSLKEYIDKMGLDMDDEDGDEEEAPGNSDDAGVDFVSPGEAQTRAGSDEAAADIADEAGQGPFSLQTIETFWQGRIPAGTSFSQPENTDVPHIDGWTKPMRLGTGVSDKHLRWIEQYLGQLAEEEILARSRGVAAVGEE